MIYLPGEYEYLSDGYSALLAQLHFDFMKGLVSLEDFWSLTELFMQVDDKILVIFN